MDLAKRSKCANCHQPFRADARNAWHQRYCKEPACRTASKAASQRRWLDKPENQDYFGGPEHVARVRAWREAHPGYGARAASSPTAAPAGVDPAVSVGAALQDLVTPQVVDEPAKNDFLAAPTLPSAAALQDLLMQQPVVLIGLLAHLSASTLQDDIALAGRRLLQLGHDVLGGAGHGEQAHPVRAAVAAHPGAIQLDRSAPGVRGASGAL
jgi:hypothetical protein